MNVTKLSILGVSIQLESCIDSNNVAPLFGALWCYDATTKYRNKSLTSNNISDNIFHVLIWLEYQKLSPLGCGEVISETLLSLSFVLLAMAKLLYPVYSSAMTLKVSTGIDSSHQIIPLTVFCMCQY